MRIFIKVLFLVLTIYSCDSSNDTTVYKPQSSGNINNVSVVIDSELWGSIVGETVRRTVGAPLYGLPQEEPQFNLSQIPSTIFSGFVKKTRLVLRVAKGPKADTRFYKDPYASPQQMVLVSGTTDQELVDQLTTNHKKIIRAFNATEIKEKQRRFRKSLFNTTALSEQLGIEIQLPSIYRIAKQENDFFWLRRDIKTGTVNLLLYTVPYEKTLTKDALANRAIEKRDSIGKRHIPGPVAGSYMTTEKAYRPFFGSERVANLNAFLTKSIWQVKDAFMSGPFINYWIKDDANKRFLVAEGFVFAPSVEKRAYVFELEAIIKSISIKK
jgi:hypothetical protein